MGSLELNGMGSGKKKWEKKLGSGGGRQISSVVWSRKKISKFTLTRSTSVKLKYILQTTRLKRLESLKKSCIRD